MFLESRDVCYEAFRSKDARFDGRLFIGVSSTGVYCRPVCRARLPKKENCTYFATAAEAEQAGYRPCLLCRPELAPVRPAADTSGDLAARAASFLEENCGSGLSMEETAARLGCTSRHLRRVFEKEYHVTPVQYQQTCRLLLAKNLLTDTDLSVMNVAMAAGFGSLRRMNELFQKQYRLSPAELRKTAGKAEKTAGDAAMGRGDAAAETGNTAMGPGNAAAKTGSITVEMGYRPPYAWDGLLKFLEARAIAGVETVTDGRYARTVRMKDRNGKILRGWIQVENLEEKGRLGLTVSESLLPALPQVRTRVRRMFDLDCDPEVIAGRLKVMDELRPGLFVPGVRIPGCFDAFETSVRIILGQQISVKAAGTLAARLAAHYGSPVETGLDGLNRSFPTAEDFLAMGDKIQENLGVLGVTSARSESIRLLAEALEKGVLHLDQSADPEEEMERLQSLRGIGSWTAQNIVMRTMGWPDAFLETDAGIRHALPGQTPKELRELSEQWRPWRSYAMFQLWNT